MDWQKYEQEKAKLQGLPPKEYEEAIKELVKRLGGGNRWMVKILAISAMLAKNFAAGVIASSSGREILKRMFAKPMIVS